MDTRPATEGAYADIEWMIEKLCQVLGEASVQYHESLIRRAHAELLDDSDTAEEFDSRFGIYLVELVGTVNEDK